MLSLTYLRAWQIKQGKGIEMPVTAAAAPQGASAPVSADATRPGRRAQGKQGKGTTKSDTAAAAPQGASAPASATIVRYLSGVSGRDRVSRSRHGNIMPNSPSPPWRLGYNIGSAVTDLIVLPNQLKSALAD